MTYIVGEKIVWETVKLILLFFEIYSYNKLNFVNKIFKNSRYNECYILFLPIREMISVGTSEVSAEKEKKETC